MANKKLNRELYSFDIRLEEEVVREDIKKVRRKNKETGKMETIEKTVEKTVTEEVPVKIIIKKPTRTQIEDGDMFYSIWLNKFIKMGLLTRSMLAKQHVDLGGSLNQDEKQRFASLYLKLYEKQQQVIRYSAKDRDKLTINEVERLERAISDLAVVRKEIADYEAAQASVFDHTADVKARNRAITWFLLHLTYYSKEKGTDVPLFEGLDYEEKYDSYQEMDESGDEIFGLAIDRLSSIITIWYMSGIQTQEDFEAVLNEINEESDQEGIEAPAEEVEEEEVEEEEVEEEEEEDTKEPEPKPKAKRGRKPKAKASAKT